MATLPIGDHAGDPSSAQGHRYHAKRHGKPTLSGYVTNEWGLGTRNLRLRVGALDAAGNVTATDIGYVTGHVTPGARVYFENPVEAPIIPHGNERRDRVFRMRQMPTRYRSYVVAVVTALALAVGCFGVVRGHEAPHGSRSTADARIDPRVTYPARLVAAGGGHFHAILVGPGARWLVAGTHLGLFRSVDRGLTWQLVAPRFSGEDVHALVRNPVTGRIHAVTHGQGLVTSTDGGRTWKDDSSGLPTHDLHALALDPRRPGRVYVWAVGHGLLARDGPQGRWQRLAPTSILGDVRTLAVHPNDSQRLYAATAKGVWMSSDGGHRWEQPPDGLQKPVAGLAVIPAPREVLIAATEDGLFVGDAMAARWRPAGTAPQWWGPVVAFAFEPAGDSVIALSHEGVVARRPLHGDEWTPLAGAMPGARAVRRE